MAIHCHISAFHASAARRICIGAAVLLIAFPSDQARARSAAPKSHPQLTSIAEVNKYAGPSAPTGIPVHLKAQISYVDAAWGILFVQDRTGAIYVKVDMKVDKAASTLTRGDLLDLRASMAPGAVGPILVNPHYTVLGRAPVHAPEPVSLTALEGGGKDCRFVLTQGVLRPGPDVWDHTSLLLQDGPAQVPIMIPGGTNTSILSLAGLVVHVRGVNSARLDTSNRRVGAQLFVTSAAEIQPENPSSIPAMRLPLQTVAQLQNLDLKQRFLPAVHLKGSIVWKSGQEAFLADNSGGILVHSASPIPADIDSVVDVVGFPDRQHGSFVLRDAMLRMSTATAISSHSDAQPRSAEWLMNSGRDGQRVQVLGKLIAQKAQGGDVLLTMEDSGIRFLVRVAAAQPSGQMITISPNELVQCDGVVRFVGNSPGAARSFELLVQSPSRLAVQTRRKVSLRAILFIAIPCLAGAVLLWIIQLNRVVHAKTVQIRRQMEQLQQARDAARVEAERDALTGLPNRRRFFQLLEDSICSATEAGQSLALLYIDLDGFKITNDTLGHLFGDLLLKEVADRFTACLGSGDTLFRIGGDEFALLITDVNAARQSADSLLHTLRSGFQIRGHEVLIGATIGISMFPHPACDATTLLLQADAAMYEAKRAGKNEVAFYTDEMGIALNEKNRLSLELKKAVERDEIFLEYQPQFDAPTLTIQRFEALARWTNPALGQVPPDKFIAIAEECGLIRELGSHILERACRDAVEWNRQSGKSIPVAVNVSTLQLRAEGFASRVFETLRNTGLAPELLEFEMTESVMVDDLGRIADTLEELRSAGISLALDDFGTGYSCLANLRQLPFNRLKVDPSFLRQADLDRGTATLITAVAKVAHALNMTVVVEGIETEREMRFVTRLGADELQGFLLGRPSSDPLEMLIAQDTTTQPQA